MRKRILIAGLVTLGIGALLFFAVSPMLASSLNLSSLLPLSSSSSLAPGQSMSFSVPGGKAFIMVYNDTLSGALNATSTATGLATEDLNGTFLVELVNSGSQAATLALHDNYTAPATVMYSTLLVNVYTIYASILSEFIGFILFIAGIIVAAAGAILKPKAPRTSSSQGAP